MRGIIKSPFEPLQETSLRLLTLKTVLLLAITTARRIGELQALSVREPFLKIHNDKIVLQTDPGFTPKVTSILHKSQDIIVPSFCSSLANSKEQEVNLLDVRRGLLHYLEVTNEFRASDALFVLYAGKQKGKQVDRPLQKDVAVEEREQRVKMEDSMDMENLAPLRPQNFLFGCELKADKKEYAFKVDDDENDHQLSLKTVTLGVGAKDELHIVEAEGMNYHAKPIKIVLASLKPSVQPTVSLGGFEITPPVTLRLKAGSGPVYVSGQHLIALEEGLESSDEEEEEEEEDDNAGIVKNAKRVAAASTSKVPQKKAKIEADEDENDFDEEDDEEDEDDDDDDEEEETPVKKPSQAAKPKSAQKSNHNGKLSEPSTPAKPAKTPEQKGKQEAKQQSPKTPKTPFTPEEIKAKMQVTLEKGGALPKIEPKFTNYVKNCFRMDDQKVIQDLWKWRQSLKDK